MPVHTVWASRVLLHRSTVAYHTKLNCTASLCNTLISSTCLIAVKVAGGPRDDESLVTMFSGETINYTMLL